MSEQLNIFQSPALQYSLAVLKGEVGNAPSQADRILAYLQTAKAITPMDALKLFGCFRLGARIWDLKHKGHNIETIPVHENGKTFASYKLMGV